MSIKTAADEHKAADLHLRTYDFARDCCLFAETLLRNRSGSIYFRHQLIRCATSVAANYRAAYIAASRKSFAAKLSICAEESNEAAYWFELIKDLKLLELPSQQLEHLLDEAIQLTRIFVASRKTLSQNCPT